MRRSRGSRILAAAVVSILAALPPLTAGAQPEPQPIDGIAALVNGEVITFGQLARALAVERGEVSAALAGALSPSAVCGLADESTDDVERVLECLIDATLVFQEVRRFPQLGARVGAVREALSTMIALFPSRSDFDAELERFALTTEEVSADLERQILVAGYVDSRFRNFVDVPERDLRRYYDEVLVPDMRRQGIEIPAFDVVSDEYIVPILREAEVNRRIQQWISDLRRRAEIHRTPS